MSPLAILLAAYGTVLVSELIGDKTLYTVSALASRYHPATIFAGLAPAFMLKMLAAVLLGQMIAKLPEPLVAGVAAASFVFAAFAVWRGADKEAINAETGALPPWTSGAATAFTTTVLSEWGDVGMVTAATLSARYHAPTLVWLGATCALLTKGLLAIGLGVGLRRFLPRRRLRYVAVAVCLTMAVLALVTHE